MKSSKIETISFVAVVASFILPRLLCLLKLSDVDFCESEYENLCNDWCHSCTGQLHKSTGRRRATSHLVSPSRPPVIYFKKSVIFIYVTGAVLYFHIVLIQWITVLLYIKNTEFLESIISYILPCFHYSHVMATLQLLSLN